VILLRHATQIDYVGCPYMVKFGDEPPQPPSTHLRDSFHQYIGSEFGASWLQKFTALFQVQDHPLAAPGEKIQEECVALTGHDYRPIEEQKYKQRQKDCEKRYGPRPPHLPQYIMDHHTAPAVSFVPDPGSLGVPPPQPTIFLQLDTSTSANWKAGKEPRRDA
jgi:hypothetical protein